MQDAIKALIPTSCASVRGQGPVSAFALNTHGGLPRREVVRIAASATTCAFDQLSIQNNAGEALVVMEDEEGSGVAQPQRISYRKPAICKMSGEDWLLANETVEVKISRKGRITSILDLQYK